MENADIRKDIPMLDEIIYMDAASTTPTPKPVVDAMCNYYYNYNANIGRGAYRTAVKASSEFEKARSKIAKFINSKPEEIIFTKNTTEAINLVAHGLDFKRGDSVIVPNIEHHSNFLPWLNLKKRGVNLKIVQADKYGVVDAADIEKAVDKTTKLITITHVSNAIGSVQPVYEVGDIAEENDLLYMVDAAQSAGHMELDVKKIKADFTAFPGHKGIMGPVGTGFLYCKADKMNGLQPENLGGGTVFDVTEDDFKLAEGHARFEGGTQNIAGVIGLGTAVDYIKNIGLDRIEKHSQKLTKLMFEGINDVDNTTVYGNPENIYGIVAFNINGANPHDVAKILDELKRICVRSGHHCAIPAIRHTGAYDFGGSVRASIHCYNTKDEVQILSETLAEISQFFGA
ncbi:aminotransferase class V-fold PLP-dependent enzyme [Methanobacterium paludis]|uniref:cysteine desulfurase n=1 Tax=Methanobacterium paludis (strain DSM 25820 / JCM 18151 / SWAN1) TaxID=868131 RepID=F6D5G4_METPW|nr:cysteine desulfurase [Methanobacterium paludis]AEG19316.1 Cysteine desulfurase [Methanobacterium paludis]